MRVPIIICALIATSLLLPAQDLLYSIATDLPGPGAPWLDEEVLRLDPGGSAPALAREALQVLIGDADQDGLLNDAPVDIDALELLGAGGIADWLFSTTTTTAIPGGSLSDGDVFRFDALGGIQVVFSEAFFESATGTSAIDVDALAVDPSGTLYFSFAEDETTTLGTLITQNNGVSVLDEQVVLRLDPGSSTAQIHLSKDQVVAAFNQALGLAVTTVVDVTALALDPTGAVGDLLLAAGSSSQSIRGRVVSTANGGQMHTLGGQPVDPTLFSLGADPAIDAIALAMAPPFPVLRALPDQGASSGPGLCTVIAAGLAPGEPIQLVVTDATLPGPFALPASTLPGFGAVFPDPAQPLWVQSFTTTPWLLLADATGVATYQFGFAGLPPGIVAVAQGIALGSLSISSPISVAVLP